MGTIFLYVNEQIEKFEQVISPSFISNPPLSTFGPSGLHRNRADPASSMFSFFPLSNFLSRRKRKSEAVWTETSQFYLISCSKTPYAFNRSEFLPVSYPTKKEGGKTLVNPSTLSFAVSLSHSNQPLPPSSFPSSLLFELD